MVITIAAHKGGVGKSTTAVHLASCLSRIAPTLLIDADMNRSVMRQWATKGKLPFKVVDERQAAMYTRQYEHTVIDTEAGADEDDLKAVVGGCHLLVLPCTPDPLSIGALMSTIGTLKRIEASRYRVLLTIIPPKPNRDGEDARELLEKHGLPLFRRGIRRTVAFQRAVLEGTTVDQVDRTGLASLDYDRVAEEMVTLVDRYVRRSVTA